MNYLGGKEIKNYYLGASTIKTIHVGDIMVYPEDVYTYTVTDFALVYSSNTYLLPNASNYAYVTAKYNTYVNGKLTKTDNVICKPNTITDAKVIIDSENHIKWNKEQYGTTVFPNVTTVKFTASYNGVTSDYFTVEIGANKIVISDVSVDDLRINNSTTPFLLATQAYYTIEVSGTRRETYTSGMEYYAESITSPLEYRFTCPDWCYVDQDRLVVSANTTGARRSGTLTATFWNHDDGGRSITIQQAKNGYELSYTGNTNISSTATSISITVTSLNDGRAYPINAATNYSFGSSNPMGLRHTSTTTNINSNLYNTYRITLACNANTTSSSRTSQFIISVPSNTLKQETLTINFTQSGSGGGGGLTPVDEE